MASFGNLRKKQDHLYPSHHYYIARVFQPHRVLPRAFTGRELGLESRGWSAHFVSLVYCTLSATFFSTSLVASDIFIAISSGVPFQYIPPR